jgi:hypothetical protein
MDGTSVAFPGGDVTTYSDAGVATGTAVVRHGLNICFVDTHVDALPDNVSTNPLDDTSEIAQSFYMAAGYGWVNNPAAGVVTPTNFTAANDAALTGSFTIGGSTTWQPIWAAAEAGWSYEGGCAPDLSVLSGSSTYKNTDPQTGSTYDIGAESNDNLASGKDSSSGTVVCSDAVGIIVSKTSKLPTNAVTRSQIAALLGVNAGTWTGTAVTTYQNHPVDVYCRDMNSGTRSFIEKTLLGATWTPYGSNPSGVYPDGTMSGYGSIIGTASGATIIPVTSSQQMIQDVGNDPYGVGYASGSEIDPDLVQVLPLNVGGVIQTWNRKAIESTTTTSADFCSANHWALQRGMSCILNNASNQAASDFFTYVTSTFEGSLIFKSSFFAPHAAGSYPATATYTTAGF